MKAGWIVLKSEIRSQIQRLNKRIASETEVYNAWKAMKECDIRTAVLHQVVGTIRGLEAGKEALEYLSKTHTEQQMSADEWLIWDQRKKITADQIDYRGGLVIQP